MYHVPCMILLTSEDVHYWKRRRTGVEDIGLALKQITDGCFNAPVWGPADKLSRQVDRSPVRLIFVILLACGFTFFPLCASTRFSALILAFGANFGLQPQSTALHAVYYAQAAALPLAIKMLMMHHHVDDVYDVTARCSLNCYILLLNI